MSDDYGSAIGKVLGTALVVGVAAKYLLPATNKLFKQVAVKPRMKGGYKKKR